RSRSSDRPRNGVIAPVVQQGRVIMDRDFNALQSMTQARIDADALDFVGPCGTPDDGFGISISVRQGGAQSFGSRDFQISPGTMYLGGERVVSPSGPASLAPYTYFNQPDWVTPGAFNADSLRELVYLNVVEQEVSAVEDPDLFEVALGGPDTTQRLKL